MTKVAAVLAAMEKARTDGLCYLAINRAGSWEIAKVA